MTRLGTSYLDMAINISMELAVAAKNYLLSSQPVVRVCIV